MPLCRSMAHHSTQRHQQSGGIVIISVAHEVLYSTQANEERIVRGGCSTILATLAQFEMHRRCEQRHSLCVEIRGLLSREQTTPSFRYTSKSTIEHSPTAPSSFQTQSVKGLDGEYYPLIPFTLAAPPRSRHWSPPQMPPNAPILAFQQRPCS